MYRCDKCGRVTQSGQSRLLVIDKTREKLYTREIAGRNIVIGKGHETVKTSNVCRTCYGLAEMPKKPDYRDIPKPVQITEYSIRLANGKTLSTDSSFELACFFASDGRSIVPPKRKKGGKSKGARSRGQKKVTRTKDAIPQ